MGDDHTLFISYAHIDNEPVPPGELGWISRFELTFTPLLKMRLGKEVNIWRDRRLQGNDVFADEIVKQFSSSAVMISIVTPRYLNSDWCTREAREFCAIAKQRGGLSIDNKSRLIKIIKTPVDSEDSLPPEMKQILGEPFFVETDGAPLELDPNYGDEYGKTYMRKCAGLAQRVAELLKSMQAKNANLEAPKPHDAPQPAKPTIYIAECSRDRRPAREILETELGRLGYPILPDRPMPTDEAEYIAAVIAMLAQSALSVHLVGEHYGAVPDGTTSKSVVVLQNELAVGQCRQGNLKRLIWLPKAIRSDNALQQAFIDTLNRDVDAQLGADVIAGNVEELKAAIHATLKKIEQPEPERSPPPDTETGAAENTRKLYLICDERDRKATVVLRKFCRERGFEVALPLFEGDAKKVRETHRQLLESCDAVLLFYGIGDEAWRRSIDDELKKMPGWRRKPLMAKGLYLAEPRTDDKQDLIDMEEPGLIDGQGSDLPESALTAFLRRAEGTP